MKKLFTILSIVVSVFFVIIAIGLWYGIQTWHAGIEKGYHTEKQNYAETFNQVLPKMLKDQKDLGVYTWLHDRKCVRDAGPILNKMVAWEGAVGDWIKKNPPEHIIDWSLLSKEGDVRKDEIPEGEHWMDRGKKTDFSKWKFSFIKSLRDKDCWDFTKNSPIESHQYATYQDVINEMISPDGSALVKVANVMLLQVATPTSEDSTEDLQNVQQVLEDVRTLGTLCLQSQEMVLMMIGSSILDRERTAFMYLQEQNRVPQNWTVLSQKEIKVLKRMIWGGVSLSKLFTPPEHHSVILSTDFRIGRCASIREGLQINAHLKDSIEIEQYIWLNTVLQKGKEMGCHLDDVDLIWQDSNLKLLNDPEFSEFWMPDMVLQGYAMVLASMAEPNEFRGYQ